MDEEIVSFLISEDIDENMKLTSYDDKIGGLSGASFFRLQMSDGHGDTYVFVVFYVFTSSLSLSLSLCELC